MVIQTPKCDCGRAQFIIHLGIIHDKDHSTWVNLSMCDKCRLVKVTAKELRNWMKGKL